jgi:hypothetical protein
MRGGTVAANDSLSLEVRAVVGFHALRRGHFCSDHWIAKAGVCFAAASYSSLKWELACRGPLSGLEPDFGRRSRLSRGAVHWQRLDLDRREKPCHSIRKPKH